MNADTRFSPYKTNRGLPPLAGLTTIEEAAKPGLAIEQCVSRLKRLHLVATFQDFDWADEVLHSQQLGDGSQARPDAARKLVAGPLHAGLPFLRHRPRSEGAGLQQQLRVHAG